MRSGRAVARPDGPLSGASIPRGGHVRRSCGEAAREPATSAWSALPTASRYGVLLLAVVLFLVALALAPPAWRAVLGVVLWLVVLPLGLLRLRARAEQRARRCDALDSATRPQPPNRI